MSDIKQKFNILATIDHLRARKARPDIDRICGYMLKKFKVSSKETKADLKRCLDSEAVFKVDYKGDVSYRNASKWKKELKSATEISKTNAMKNNPSTEQRLMTTAMAELIFSDPDYLEQGVPPHKLMKAISTKDNVLHSKKYVEGIIQKELETGGLVQMDNGNFALGAGDGEQDGNAEIYYNGNSNTKLTSSNNSSSTSSPMRVKGKPGRKKGSCLKKMMGASCSFVRSDTKRGTAIRVGERRKRAKKVFDPSDNNMPSKRKRGRPVGSLNKATIKKQHVNNASAVMKEINMFRHKSKSESAESSDDVDNETNDSQSLILDTSDKVMGGVCSVCRQHNSIKDNSGKLVGCRDCSNKAHPSCLQGDGMLRLRPDNSWQCPHCKTCVVCIETTDAGILTVCSICADAYHALCHSPHIPERFKAWDQWECRNCQETRTSGQNIDSAYMDKLPGSDHSSKYSDRSDSRKSSLDRRLDKASVKSLDSDDKMEKNESKSSMPEKDQSHSPISIDKPDWKYSRKLISPVMKSKHDWKYKKNTIEDKISDEHVIHKTALDKSDKSLNSIFMDSHEFNKFYNINSFKKHPYDKEEGTIDPSIPDANKWTYNDVYQYFSSLFPDQAHVFKEQEIDGKSLLLMQRSDVISNFGLPLGPALKLYRHVVKLQSRKNDFTMCWL